MCGHERHGVGGGGRGVVAEVYLVVQVRSGGVAAAADDADDLPGDDGLAFGDGWVGEHVAIPRDDAAVVGYVHVPAFSAPSKLTHRLWQSRGGKFPSSSIAVSYPVLGRHDRIG